MPNQISKTHGTVKLSVNVPSEAVIGLQAYAVMHEITMTEAISRALGLQKFIGQEVAKGGKILIERRNGKIRELVV